MKLGVIGEPCIDFIHRQEINTAKHFGGILYSVVSLAVIAPNEEIIPVMNLGSDEFENVKSFLSGFSNISMDFVREVNHKTRNVNLYYESSTFEKTELATKIYDREENSTEPTLPVTFEMISELLPELDGLLINMVSGVDIDLDSIEKIRNNFKNPIHLDLHNLVMKTKPNGERVREKLEGWHCWCLLPDTIQMNEAEISIMTGDNFTENEIADRIIRDSEHENSSCVKCMVITRGKNGASLFQRKINKDSGNNSFEIDKTDFPSIKTKDFRDSTGCGDVFAASFFYKNLLQDNQNYFRSVNYAIKLASINCSLIGVEELRGLKV